MYLRRLLFLIALSVGSFAFAQPQSELDRDEHLRMRYKILSKEVAPINASFKKFVNKLPILLEMEGIVDSIKHHHTFKINYYSNVAHHYRYFELWEESARLLNKYFDLMSQKKDQSKIPFKDKSTMTFNLGMQGISYARMNKMDSAVIMHRKNINYSKNTSSIYHASAHNNLGLHFLNYERKMDSALHYFKLSKEIVEDSTDHFFGSVIDNLADVYHAKGQLKKAQSLYRQNVDFYASAIHPTSNKYDFGRHVNAVVQYVDVSSKLNEPIELLIKEMDKVGSYIDTEKSTLITYDHKIRFYQTAEKLARASGNIKKAYEMSTLVSQLVEKQKMEKFENQKAFNKIIAQDRLADLRATYQIQKAAKENKIAQQRLNFWVTTLILALSLGVLSFLYYRRKKSLETAEKNKLLVEQQAEITALKNQQLVEEIKTGKKDLSDFAINLTQSQEWAREVAKQLETIKTTKGRARTKKIVALEDEVLSKINVDDSNKLFYERLDKLSGSFYDKLTSIYPNLTKNDKQLCSLIRLNISNKEIATLQNITVASLNTGRYRLRKKLNLNEGEELDAFIQNL